MTTKCVGLPLCNVRFLCVYFQAIVRCRTKPEVLTHSGISVEEQQGMTQWIKPYFLNGNVSSKL